MAVIPIAEPRVKPPTPPHRFALFALGFRPFYLLAAGFAALLVPAWLAILFGALPLGPSLPALLWHGHEMIFGFVCAVIVGFLLTAGRNWTGLATPSGGRLAALAALWLAGRIALLWAPALLAVAIDLLFLPCAAVVLARVLIRAQSRRNYFVLLILALLTLVNLAFHGAWLGWWPLAAPDLLHGAVALITVLETVIAGRIVPSFTANALKTVPWRHPRVDQLAIGATALSLLSWACGLTGPVVAGLAALAAVAQAWRCWGWRPGPTWRTPLLWILHLSHGWIIVALGLLCAVALGWQAGSVPLHLLTVGAMSGLILGMITRTALGHTGRLLRTGRIELACYLLLQVALAARVLPPLLAPTWYRPGLEWAGAAWTACFVLYLWRYAPILIAARVDGREG